MQNKLRIILLLLFGLVISIPGFCEDEAYKVRSIKTIKEYGKSFDWGYSNNLILSAKRGRDRYFDVFVMNPDGSGEICLTCNKSGCPQKHNGNPAWHPSGDYIVFTAENMNNPSAFNAKEYAIPGTGFGCDLWAMISDGEKFYQLTDYPNVPYTTTHRLIKNNKEIFIIDQKGNIKLVSLNLKDNITKNYLILAERKEVESFLNKNPEFRVLKKELPHKPVFGQRFCNV